MQRQLAAAGLLAAAIGGPYVAYENLGVGGQPVEQASEQSNAADEITTGYLTSTSSANSSSTTSDAMPQFRPISALSEVVRFDISPSWVPQRFPRVSIVSADPRLDAMRVPLVTGTNPNDLAGTLTYYFDRYKRLQRVTVHALSGDPSRFVAELQHAYQLQQQPSLGGGLYIRKWNGLPTSLVYTAPAPVITADEPYSRYQFFLEINQPGLEFGMSSEAMELLASGQQTQRW